MKKWIVVFQICFVLCMTACSSKIHNEVIDLYETCIKSNEEARYVDIEITKILTTGTGFDKIESKTVNITIDREDIEMSTRGDFFNDETIRGDIYVDHEGRIVLEDDSIEVIYHKATKKNFEKAYETFVLLYVVPSFGTIEYDAEDEFYEQVVSRNRFESSFKKLYDFLELDELSSSYGELRMRYYNLESDQFSWAVIGYLGEGDSFTHVDYPFYRVHVTVSFND